VNDADLWCSEGELPPEEEEAWCEQERERVLAYLKTEGVEHGEVGEWPAWSVPPYVAIWAVESLDAPGWVGWWAISGDAPCDYCSAAQPAHPRKAVHHFSRTWRQAARAHLPGGERFENLGLPPQLAPLLEERAAILEAWAADDAMWPR
jgi:hypothetical protein